MTSLACIGEPVSWLRLEMFAAGRIADPAIASHLTACPACTASPHSRPYRAPSAKACRVDVSSG